MLIVNFDSDQFFFLFWFTIYLFALCSVIDFFYYFFNFDNISNLFLFFQLHTTFFFFF